MSQSHLVPAPMVAYVDPGLAIFRPRVFPEILLIPPVNWTPAKADMIATTGGGVGDNAESRNNKFLPPGDGWGQCNPVALTTGANVQTNLT